MARAYDVEAGSLIRKTAEALKKEGLPKPDFVGLVKSGAHLQRPPEDPDFWYVRCASILWQTYVRGKTGTNRLRRHYGGRVERGVKPERHKPAGGSTIRRGLQALETAGYLKKEKAGRVLSPKGRALLDRMASGKGG